VTNIRELTDEEADSLFKTARFISTKLNDHLKPVGFNYGFNEGSYAGQSVEHFHFHIIPRFNSDNLPEFHLFHRHPDTKKNLNMEELEKYVNEYKILMNKDG
jgi:diadenosine tetraphosphate (Ap4A) HIT family hydrolase